MTPTFKLRPAHRGIARWADARAMAAILARWIADTSWFETRRPASASPRAMRKLIATGDVWLAIGGGRRLLGFIAVQSGEIAALYVHPAVQGAGIGKALLAQSRQQAKGDLRLTTFAANQQALDFYLAQGCVEQRRTAGDNEEGLPDIRLTCPALPATPLAQKALI